MNSTAPKRSWGLLGATLLATLANTSTAAIAQATLASPPPTESSPLEAVRSAYGAGRNKEALILADQALAGTAGVSPEGATLAELHFWRGATLRRLERHDEALIALDTSSRLGLRVPELYLERALSRRSLKQDEAAERDYQEAERLLPPDDARRLRFAERWGQAMKAEPTFQLTVTPQFGFDSNLFGLALDAPTLDADAEEESLYYGLVLGLRYFLHRSDTQLLALEYRNELRDYVEDRDLSYSDSLISLLGRQPFMEGADIEVRATLGEAFSDGDGHLRTVRSVAPAFLLRFSPAVQARLWGDWTDADYYLGEIPAEQDRDGVIRRAGIVFGLDLGAGWSLAPHFGVAEYDADGDDYDHRDHVAGLALTTGQYLGCVFSPSLSYIRAGYEHENSLTGFSEKREDRIWRLALAIVLRELEGVLGYAPSVTLAYQDHASNIDEYDYARWEPRIEMTLVAMTF